MRSRRSLRVLMSAGPTREPIDPVRFLSNYSTGFLGACLTREALRRGHRVTVVSGPTNIPFPAGARLIRVEQAREMQAALRQQLRRADVLIMAAAVCDFRPSHPRRTKLPRRRALRLALDVTPEIVGTLPRRRGQVVVGFALETDQIVKRAKEKLHAKRLDLLVGQQLHEGSSPFGQRPVDAILLRAAGPMKRLGNITKPRLARALLDEIEQLWYGDEHGVGQPRLAQDDYRSQSNRRAGARPGWRATRRAGDETPVATLTA